MTDTELQTADETVELSESAPDEEIQEGVEPTETAETTETAEDVPNQRYAKRFDKVYGEAREAERQAEALRAENQQLRSQLPQEQRPVVPEPPDPYDADYAGKLKDYTEAVAATATYDAGQKARTEADQRQQFEAQQKLQGEWITRAQTYTEKAKALGVSPEKLQETGSYVARAGVNNDVTQYILEHEKGPLITQYLATHTEELDQLVGMNTAHASVYIQTVITPKASASSGVSGAPEPPDSLGGGGAPPTQRGPAGATFE